MKEIKLVLVEWLDILSCDEAWMDLEEVEELEPLPVFTIGKMISDGKDVVIVASSWGKEADESFLGNINCIPRGVIKSIREISTPFAPCFAEVPKKRDDGSYYSDK